MRQHCAGEVTENDPECLRRPKKAGRESYVVGWGPNEFTPLGTLKDYDVIDQLGDIKEPALIINGGNDLCTPYVAKFMSATLSNPCACMYFSMPSTISIVTAGLWKLADT